MRTRAALAAATATLLTAGCYTNAAVAPAKVRKIAQPAAAPVEVGSSAFDGVRLGPRTSVRARRDSSEWRFMFGAEVGLAL
jgi:hypothetical protein